MNKGNLAEENFNSGLNCAQAVVLAFKDELNLSEDVLSNLARGFGGGLARQRLTCGAVSGLTMVLSLYYKNKSKQELYAIIQKACEEFKKEAGSLICGELLSGVNTVKGNIPEERTEEYYKKRPCGELCKIAADIVEKIIKE